MNVIIVACSGFQDVKKYHSEYWEHAEYPQYNAIVVCHVGTGYMLKSMISTECMMFVYLIDNRFCEKIAFLHLNRTGCEEIPGPILSQGDRKL